jgi:hypothetical protein
MSTLSTLEVPFALAEPDPIPAELFAASAKLPFRIQTLLTCDTPWLTNSFSPRPAPIAAPPAALIFPVVNDADDLSLHRSISHQPRDCRRLYYHGLKPLKGAELRFLVGFFRRPNTSRRSTIFLSISDYRNLLGELFPSHITDHKFPFLSRL